MVSLGFGKFVRSDRIFALEPLIGDERGDGHRTRVWIEGVKDPIIAARTEVTILRDMGQEAVATEAPLIDEALDLASRLAAAAEAGRVDLNDLGRRARHLLASTTTQDRLVVINAAALSLVDHAPVSVLRLRSLALIHIWRPSGPRTRPHHSPRSRTQ